ncbi:LysR family transcriptional regulator [Dyella mobilis]|uniref:LysR family transcriptional regulator n=1 Tax=Dyella mobilis TaxID=1849582 RepID=A0ABS2KIY2_9GAMM|nr:LysR family transcriptional regulator [Dyella mobilis]MBM7131039.1 LysR family transcriptional regulator [Dyella mobilis]GLQ97666.1 LysR family transcriptional regulator [Dyella mobilis]
MSRDLPSLNALRAFEATARLGSVSRAAEELHVTHGAISRQLRVLEQALGQPLFTRLGRGIALTAVGEQLRDRVANAFDQLRDGWSELQRSRGQAPFVLSCPSSLLARWVIPRLDRLERDLPALRLHLSPEEDPLAPQRAEPDAALVLAAAPWPAGWQVHELAPERIGPVVSPRYPGLVRLREHGPAALENEALLHTSSRPQAWPTWAKAGDVQAALHYGQGFTRLFYMLEAAVAGLGVAIAPEQLVQDDLDAGRLLAPWGFRQTDAQWILAAPRRRNDSRIEALAAWLRRALAPSADAQKSLD